MYFWKLVNRNKKNNTTVHPLKLKDGKVITDPDCIRQTWKAYFEELYTPLCNTKFDNDFKIFIEQQLYQYEYDCNLYIDDILNDTFSMSELEPVIATLKNNKAPGWDNITAELIKYGGEMLWICLLKLYNIIIVQEYIPKHFRIGLMVPIPKGSKDKTIQDNYRGITLLTVIGKIFEKCISNRFG